MELDDGSEHAMQQQNNPSRRHVSTKLRTEEARLEPLSVGGKTGSRDVIYPTPGDRTLGERPMVPGERKKTQRKDELRRQVSDDAVQGLVVDADGALHSMDEWMII